jgi:hypothetical protein
LINLATDIILAFSDKPLRLLISRGLSILTVSLIDAIRILIQCMRREIIVLGYTSLIVSVWLLFGLIIVNLGVVGICVEKTFEGVNKRPIYIVSNVINHDTD